MAGTVTGGGARPTINITGSIRGYTPSSRPGRTGGSSSGGSSASESMDFTDFLVTPYDMQKMDNKNISGHEVYKPVKPIGEPIEVRMEKLRANIEDWESVKNALTDSYDKNFGKGIEFTHEEGMFNLFSLLNILKVNDLLGVGHLNGIYTFDGPYLDEKFTGEIIDIVKEYGLIERLQAYLNGASWEESGLADIYGADGENSFLFNMAEHCYSKEFDEKYYFDNYESLDPDVIKKGCIELFHLNDPNADFNPYQTFEELNGKVENVRMLHEDINQISAQIYNYKQLEKLLPFTYVAENPDFGKYLERDYASDSTIPDRLKENLSQEEMAVYIYLLEHNGKDKANEYIDAMEDQINRRIGMRNAAEYIETMNKNGLDIGDFFVSSGVGFYDGTKNFFDGLKDFVMADGVMSAFEYEMMYKLVYLAESNEFNDQLSAAEREFLKFNYQSWQAIGNMWIPSAVSFIPVVGKPLSSGLLFMSSAGNTTEGAMQQGVDATHAYLYGCLSGLSEVTFERLIGGIPGLSNMGESFIINCFKEGGEEFLQEWIDAGLRWMVLNEPIDLESTIGDSLYAALQGMAVSGIMQSGQKVIFKLGGTSIDFNGNESTELVEFINSLQTSEDGSLSNNEIISNILEMDNNSSLKKDLMTFLLNPETVERTNLLAGLDPNLIEQIKNYCAESGLQDLAQTIMDHQRSQDSLTAKKPMEEIVELDYEARKHELQNFSPEDIAVGLENLSRDSYRTIMDTLTKEEKLKVIYAQAALAAQGKYRGFFMNFREHAELHTNEVRDYAVDIAKEVPGINVDEVYYGAQFHDLGMRGGVFKLDGKYVPIDSLTIEDLTMKDLESYIKNSNGWGKLTDAEMDQKMFEEFGIENWSSNKDMSRLPQEVVDLAFSNKLAEIARKNHPLNSAIAILTEDVTPDGIDKNIVALLAMTHSKSTSGIRNFDSITEWQNCIEKLRSALIDSGMDMNEVDTITDGLNEAINNPESFQRLIDEALCIRDGDAMSKVPLIDGDTLMQDGNVSHVDYTGKAKLSGYSEVPTTAAAEQAGIIDTLYDPEGNKIGSVDNLFSKKTHAGELNVTFDSKYDGHDYSATARITDPTKAPFASLDAAFERAGEVATYSNCNERVFEIELPADMQGTPLAEWYESQITSMANAEIATAQEKGYSSKQLVDFYTNMIKIVYR